MEKKKILVQEIAVFGESGSGKTVLVSSFYGRAMEPEVVQKSGFQLVAADMKQHKQVFGAYLGMRDEAEAPVLTHQRMNSYRFAVNLKTPKKTWAPVMNLVWHDYPGEWFETDALSGAEEQERRVRGFRTLLGSNVALLLIDGQKLHEHAGNEKAYLKEVLASYQISLAKLRADILIGGKPLAVFPRIWMFALTKADLLPDLTAERFRDLMLGKVSREIGQLEDEIAGFVATPEALSVGDEFLLTSSAEFTPEKIDVAKRKGVDLVLPIAAILPLEWHVKWGKIAKLPTKTAIALLDAGGLIALLPFALKFLNKLPLPAPVKLVLQATTIIDLVVGLLASGGDALKKKAKAALEHHDYVIAALLEHRIALERGEEQRVLLRHP